MEKIKQDKKFKTIFISIIIILAFGFVRKNFQNDTFYTIKIGELIMKNGIDMLDHFSFHTGLAYTYPHWLYDVFIYLIYHNFGFFGIYASTIILLMILLLIVFKIDILACNKNYLIAALSVFVGGLAISGFATARAQLVSFIIFATQILFIESFLKNGKKGYLLGLLVLSLLLCNIHVAVWPFYFIVYLPYLAEYLIATIVSKIKLKKENKFIKFIKSRIILERSENIKYLFIIMLLSTLTGLLTPIKDTPYTYLYKTMIGNTQKYISEHQMISWRNSPFTIIITFETFFLACLSKVKLRDLFMISGLSFMAIISARHIALLALIGTICFGRTFTIFLENYDLDLNKKVFPFFMKKSVIIISFIIVIAFSVIMTYMQNKKHYYVEPKLYPVEAVKYIKENINIDEMRIFNDYNFGSYLMLENIPVFIDSRADLYTKEFSGLEYDIFLDYEFMASHYQEKFEFYKITHALIYKKDNPMYVVLKHDTNYKVLYEDKYFILYEKLGTPNYTVKYNITSPS